MGDRFLNRELPWLEFNRRVLERSLTSQRVKARVLLPDGSSQRRWEEEAAPVRSQERLYDFTATSRVAS